MIRKLLNLVYVAVSCAAVQAANINTTLNVTASGAIGAAGIAATGTATLANIGSGTFSGTVGLTPDSTGNFSAPFTITLTTITSGAPGAAGDKINGTLKVPSAVLSGSGTGSGTITGGTGGYANATGSFPAIQGTGAVGAAGISLTFKGDGTITTGGSGGPPPPATPSITRVQNNYSYILPGLPNYGIAPGALFIIQGSNLNNQPLSQLQSSAAPGLPTTFNQTSISVTVGSTTVTPGIYYTSPTQLAAVLPSNTPVGTGTITVTNAGLISAPAPIQVVQSALGLDTYYGTGTGLAVAQDANFNLFSISNSAKPNQTIILWGSGVGPDTSNDDKTYPLKQNNLASIPMTVYIGGISANIAYRGRSQFPGVDQIVVTIPANVPTGCGVSIIVLSGNNLVSNAVTIPVSASGGTCSDPNSFGDPNLLSQLAGKSTVNYGFTSINRLTSSGQTTSTASASFFKEPGSIFSGSGSTISIGSCFIPQVTASGTTVIPTGLDAGTITLNQPSGPQLTLQTTSLVPGVYFSSSVTIPSSGGAFVFNGGGGKDIGSFTSNVNFPVPLVWTNQSSITSVNRSQGVTLTWTGGAPGTYAVISGFSGLTGAASLTVNFICYAAVSAGTFTVPSAVLLALPASNNGGLELSNYTNPTTFTASGLDLGYGAASVSTVSLLSYQ